MSFDLNKEQIDIRKAAREFAEKEFREIRLDLDAKEMFDDRLWKKAADLGFLGVFVDEKYGGAGMGYLEQCLIIEEFARVDLGITHAIESSFFGTQLIMLAGTEEQLEQYDRLIGFTGHKVRQKGPVLVLGGGRVGRSVADTLKARGIDFRVVEKRERIASQDERFIQGSAADRDVLQKAGIDETPSILITTHDDNLNIYLTIYCRRLRPDVQIISRASLDRNINTLHRAGANLVMSYTSLSASTIINLLQPGKLLMLSEGLNVFRMSVPPNLENRPLRDLRIREQAGCSVVAVQRGEQTHINPDPTIVLNRADELILIGSVESEKVFMETYADF